MRRLAALAHGRLRHERGAIAVITAILMTVLLGFTALVVDVGGLYFERGQLQNGADAAALAIAQNCARGSCGDIGATATGLAGKNSNDGVSSATASVDSGSNTVTVKTSTLTANGQHTLASAFAPVLGIPDSGVGATASASWGSPAAATVFPFTTPICLYDHTPPGQILWITTSMSCTDAKGNVVPGGFGWLDESSPCAAFVDITAQVGSAPGKSGPPCNMPAIINTTILIPVYSLASGQGQNATYTISAFAAFHLLDWSWPGKSGKSPTADCGCTGIKGYFTELVSLDNLSNWSVARLGGPTLNASFVSLSK